MNPQLNELDGILRQLISEHRRLLKSLESQQAAMKKLDTRALEDLAPAQEACRLSIATLENRRKMAVAQLARAVRLPGAPTLVRLAEAFPQDKARLLAQRDELRAVIEAVSSKATVAGKVAGAVLGHLNTMVRLLAGAVQQAGVYTKHGTPQVSGRIGRIEAVG